MKTDVECLCCFLRQTIRTAKQVDCDNGKRFYVLQEVAAIIAKMEKDKSPVANAGPVYKKISELTDCEDPYLELKQQSNESAMEHLPLIKAEIEGEKRQLELAARFAIAGNIIDYGALDNIDLQDALQRCRTDPLVVDDIKILERNLAALNNSAIVLYLADNSGEIVFDALLVEILHGYGHEVIVAVKGGPIINDALVSDAVYAGLDKYGQIITNGTQLPGTVLDECSKEFCDIFNSADLIIAKGQGNFESLSEVNREIFFLLTVKCVVAAKHLAELSEQEPSRFRGRGEMAVYFSGK